AISPDARATFLYWDTNQATANSGTTASGNWDGAAINWNTVTSGTGGTPQAGTTANDDLTFFSGTGYTGTSTIAVSSGRSAGSLTFNNGTVNLNGGSITLG